MIVSDRFIFSDKIKKRKLPKIVKKLNRSLKLSGVYLVLLTLDGPNLLEASSPREFYRALERGNKKTVIGIAKDRDDAFECIGVITQRAVDSYKDMTKDILVKEYID